MSEMVRVKETNQIGYIECYEGDGDYIINLEDGTQGWFEENELEFLNSEPYSNENHKVIKNLILALNNTADYNFYDIDSEDFITLVCEKTGLSKESYAEIMELKKDSVYAIESNMDDKTLYDVCVYGYVYTFAADNENEAKSLACDMYWEETGLKAYTDDEAVVWKIHGEYPYEWE